MMYNLRGLQHETMILIFILDFEAFDENGTIWGLSHISSKHQIGTAMALRSKHAWYMTKQAQYTLK